MNYFVIALTIGIMVASAWVPIYVIYNKIKNKPDRRIMFHQKHGLDPCFCLMSNGDCIQDRPFYNCPCILYDVNDIIFYKGINKYRYK